MDLCTKNESLIDDVTRNKVFLLLIIHDDDDVCDDDYKF